MKRNKITFIETVSWPPLLNEKPQLPVPKPASKHVPEWYAKSERWVSPSNEPVITYNGSNPGLKLCVPFLDGMTSGYMLELHTDVQVTYLEDVNDVNVNWLSIPEAIIRRDEKLGEKIPRPAGHINAHFAWVGHWGIKLPKGWSALLVHPLNRFDLPFTTLGGLMDSDESVSSGNIPFFMKANFTGLIPAGTPIAQVIPVKREEWYSEIGGSDLKKQAAQQAFDSRRVLEGHYKKNFWKRKKYQ